MEDPDVLSGSYEKSPRSPDFLLSGPLMRSAEDMGAAGASSLWLDMSIPLKWILLNVLFLDDAKVLY
jgi:hypothetical protein